MTSPVRKPVKPSPVPNCARGGCDKPAEWRIRGSQGDTAETCTEHVGELLAPGVNDVRPISFTR